MADLLRRYRDYLARKATEARPGIGLVEMQWQTIPWTAPLWIAIGIGYWFDLKGGESLLVSLPLLGITMFGVLFVGWVFLTEGPIANYKRACKRDHSDDYVGTDREHFRAMNRISRARMAVIRSILGR